MTDTSAESVATGTEVLTLAEMYRADALAVDAGASGETLMENAGRAVASEVASRWPKNSAVLVLCGPGNNGGDGFVIARALGEAGYGVRLAAMLDRDAYTGDAGIMAERWSGEVLPLDRALNGDDVHCDVIVDCLFGAGLSRNIEGRLAGLVDSINNSGHPVVAVDIPSGIDGDTGQVRGAALQAQLTVTFFRKKPGHLLLPGRARCGEIVVADIGIPHIIIAEISPKLAENKPEVWLHALPKPGPEDHKYSRGHAVVVSGGMASTGAARLGAVAALRAGAGAVTVASPPEALAVNAAHLTEVMLRRLDKDNDLSVLLSDGRITAVLVGPGNGVGDATRVNTFAALGASRAAVLDADALTSFEADAETLFTAIKANPDRPVVLTPHEGEFGRLFGVLAKNLDSKSQARAPSKLDLARQAAEQSGAVVVFKGADTVIAAPDGRVVINTNAPPWLATAGSGDILAGIATGLLAQGMAGFEAACAAVWLHGEAGNLCGRGLIAGDLAAALPQVLRGF